jgi:hypothetical protein
MTPEEQKQVAEGIANLASGSIRETAKAMIESDAELGVSLICIIGLATAMRDMADQMLPYMDKKGQAWLKLVRRDAQDVMDTGLSLIVVYGERVDKDPPK